MERRPLRVRMLPPAQAYYFALTQAEQIIVSNDIQEIQKGDFSTVRVKQLRGPIREIICGKHRFTYFQLDSVLYFVRGFRKKSAKTPPKEIEYAETIYKIIRNNI